MGDHTPRTDWLKPKLTYPATKGGYVPKKQGPRETGKVDDFSPYRGRMRAEDLPTGTDFLKDRLRSSSTERNTVRKKGPRDIGRNQEYQVYKDPEDPSYDDESQFYF